MSEVGMEDAMLIAADKEIRVGKHLLSRALAMLIRWEEYYTKHAASDEPNCLYEDTLDFIEKYGPIEVKVEGRKGQERPEELMPGDIKEEAE